VTAPGSDPRRRLRILVVNWLDRENPLAGGAETHLHEVFGRLASQGHAVTALVSGWPGCARRSQLDGIDVRRAGTRYTFSLAGPKYARKELRAEKTFDVVVEDLNKVPLFTPFWASAPVVLLAHHLFGATAFQAGPFPVALATWWLERPLPLVYRRVPAVAVSESTRDDLVARGLRRDRIEVIPNGIDLEWYTPSGKKSAAPTLLYVGRLKAYKRVDLVVDALRRLVDRGIDAQLDIAGKGEEAGPLRDLVASHRLEDRVRFLGFVTEEAKLDLLRRSWVHVLTSSKEGWGISILEAAACATPSVASDAPGLRESVVDGRTGVLVRHGDVDALASALETLIRDPERRNELGAEARRFAQGFTWDAAAAAFEELLYRVVPRGGGE